MATAARRIRERIFNITASTRWNFNRRIAQEARGRTQHGTSRELLVRKQVLIELMVSDQLAGGHGFGNRGTALRAQGHNRSRRLRR